MIAARDLPHDGAQNRPPAVLLNEGLADVADLIAGLGVKAAQNPILKGIAPGRQRFFVLSLGQGRR